MRILHVGSESAFVDFLVGYFEKVAPGQNAVVRFPTAAGTGVAGTARAAAGYARDLALIVRAARRADVVVAHMLTLPSALAIVSARAGTFSVWSGWGADYYDDEDGLLGPQTSRLVGDLDLRRGPRGGRPVQILTKHLVNRAVQRVAVFSAPIPDDYDVMRRRHPAFHGRYQQLNYADVSSFAGGSPRASAGDILLGNSAWMANNHLEALEKLATLELGDRKVFTPLTYGEPRYRDAVVKRGRDLLGDAFEPLLHPLPFPEYLDRVSRCGIIVMNHYRQQGLGNVGIGLYSGAHLYLSQRNPLYNFMTRSGLDVEDIETVTSLPHEPVTGAALDQRRAHMERIWGHDVVLENVRLLLAEAASRA